MKIVLLGGGGHCAACVDVILSSGRGVEGVLDRVPGAAPAGTRWLGDDSWLDSAHAGGSEFLVSVGQVAPGPKRRQLFDALDARGLALARVASAHSVVSPSAKVGAGTIVMHAAVVNARARVGRNCIVNTASLVEHDAEIEDHCHIATGAIVNGGARIGVGAMVGSGAVILQGVSVAAGAMVGAGAVVTRDITTTGTWVGVPARRVA